AAAGGVGGWPAQIDVPQDRQLVGLDQRERVTQVIADDERLAVGREDHAARVGLGRQAGNGVVLAGVEILAEADKAAEAAERAEAGPTEAAGRAEIQAAHVAHVSARGKALCSREACYPAARAKIAGGAARGRT